MKSILYVDPLGHENRAFYNPHMKKIVEENNFIFQKKKYHEQENQIITKYAGKNYLMRIEWEQCSTTHLTVRQ